MHRSVSCASRCHGWPLEMEWNGSCAHRYAAVVGTDKAGHRPHIHSEILVLVAFQTLHASRYAHGTGHTSLVHGVGVHHDDGWSAAVIGRAHVLCVLWVRGYLLLVERAVILGSRLIHVLTGSGPCLSLSVRLGLGVGMCLDRGLGLSLCDMHRCLHMMELRQRVYGRWLEWQAVVLCHRVRRAVLLLILGAVVSQPAGVKLKVIIVVVALGIDLVVLAVDSGWSRERHTVRVHLDGAALAGSVDSSKGLWRQAGHGAASRVWQLLLGWHTC